MTLEGSEITISGKTITFEKFSGINNLDDSLALTPDALTQAENVYIDKLGKIKTRDGFTLLSAGDRHSLWSNGTICLFVQGAELKRLHDDFTTTTTIRTGLTPGAAMSYVDINGVVYYSNRNQIGFIESFVDNAFVTPTKRYMISPEPGQLLEYYNGRLLIARDNVLSWTNVGKFDEVDERWNFLQMTSDISMIKAVSDGMYISDMARTWFLKGSDVEDFVLQPIATYPAVKGTPIIIEAGQQGIEGLFGNVAMWSSIKGVCIGGSGGQFINKTIKRYNMHEAKEGASLVRTINGSTQFISALFN